MCCVLYVIMIYTYQMENQKRLRRRIESLERERKGLLKRLMEPGEMVAGSVYATYRRCGKPMCRCAHGELHGPFTSLSISKQGKRSLKHVRHEDENWVTLRAMRYREYQRMMARLRKINTETLGALRNLRDRHLKTYS